MLCQCCSRDTLELMALIQCNLVTVSLPLFLFNRRQKYKEKQPIVNLKFKLSRLNCQNVEVVDLQPQTFTFVLFSPL